MLVPAIHDRRRWSGKSGGWAGQARPRHKGNDCVAYFANLTLIGPFPGMTSRAARYVNAGWSLYTYRNRSLPSLVARGHNKQSADRPVGMSQIRYSFVSVQPGPPDFARVMKR